jgi:hypothetical protein
MREPTERDKETMTGTPAAVFACASRLDLPAGALSGVLVLATYLVIGGGSRGPVGSRHE